MFWLEIFEIFETDSVNRPDRGLKLCARLSAALGNAGGRLPGPPEAQSWDSKFHEHRSSGQDVGTAMLLEVEDAAAVAGDEMIGLAGFSHREQEIVRGVDGAVDRR